MKRRASCMCQISVGTFKLIVKFSRLWGGRVIIIQKLGNLINNLQFAAEFGQVRYDQSLSDERLYL